MKGRILKSIRTKIIIAVAVTGIISYVSVMIFKSIAQILYSRPFFHGVLSTLSHNIGIQATMYISGVLFFVSLFYLLTRKHIKYLEDIVKTINGIEGGNLNLKADIRADDELGNLAAAINKMAEKIRISMEEERNTEAAKKDLITSISHDLRTPLTSVIGFLGLLTNRGGHKDEELERYAAIAYKKALKLHELIDDLFEYTRVSYSSLKINMAGINLIELLEQLLEEFYPQLEENGMEIRLSVLQDKLYVNADGDLIARMFENILTNAVRYGKDGRFIDIKIHVDKFNALIDIINYGEIIPEESLKRIFEKFYRAEPSRSRETGGTGLGLAIASSIAQIHCGSITASSGKEGTCFRISLPISNKGGLTA